MGNIYILSSFVYNRRLKFIFNKNVKQQTQNRSINFKKAAISSQFDKKPDSKKRNQKLPYKLIPPKHDDFYNFEYISETKSIQGTIFKDNFDKLMEEHGLYG